jgi:hypothetical protein
MTIELVGKLMEYNAGTMKRDDGTSFPWSSAILATDDGVYNLKSDVDLKSYLGDVVKVTIELRGTVKKPTVLHIVRAERV